MRIGVVIFTWYPLSHGYAVPALPKGEPRGGCAARRRGVRRRKFGGAAARQHGKNRPAVGGTVDKLGWVRYTIDEKGTTSKAVPHMLG